MNPWLIGGLALGAWWLYKKVGGGSSSWTRWLSTAKHAGVRYRYSYSNTTPGFVVPAGPQNVATPPPDESQSIMWGARPADWPADDPGGNRIYVETTAVGESTWPDDAANANADWRVWVKS